MPPLASSNRPMRRAAAPVKAPFSWPKSSLSTRPGGKAAQLILISGLSLRLLAEWMARAISLAGAGLAGDQHGGVRGGDAADLVEHALEGGALADEFLEIAGRFEFVLQVEVLLLQAGSFGLGEDAIGDVHPDRAAGPHLAVGPADRSHPQADPQRPAVLPAHLHFQPGQFLARQEPVEGFGVPRFSGRGVGEELGDWKALQFFRGKTDQLRRPAVGAENPAVNADGQIADRRFFVKIAKAPLTGA